MNVVHVDPEHPSEQTIRAAAELIRAGRLVAFPTETVYGLGASALDAIAVNRIYQVKGRPSFNPLIVHVDSAAAARLLTTEWPPAASLLAERFWPGPLTLVLRRSDLVPANVSAGLPTVAIRSPVHPVALALLRAAQLPIAAPSANRSNALSPTCAEHVLASLGERVDMILDGGASAVGIESTVVDLTRDEPTILRPGSIDREVLEQVLGRGVAVVTPGAEGLRSSPGLLGKHYAPRAAVTLFDGDSELRASLHESSAQQRRVGALLHRPRELAEVTTIVLPADPLAYASALFASLHQLDATCDVILIERVPDGAAWDGVRDRLTRAAGS